MACQGVVEFRVARIDAQARKLEQFVPVGDHHDVVATDTSQHLRRELLIAPAEDEAVAAQRRHDDDHSREPIQQPEDPPLVEIAANQFTVDHCVDAQQRLLDAKLVGNRAYRRARSEQIKNLRLHFLDDGGSDLLFRLRR